MTDSFQIGRYTLSLRRPHIMGILNLTPDSFYADSRHTKDNVLAGAKEMAEQGASVLDLGGESTRPGSQAPSEQEEIDRVLSAVETLHAELDIPLSVDTSNPKLMDLALTAGASMINDIRALARPGAMDIVAKHEASVCLMHMQGEPQTMQNNPQYANPTQEIIAFLNERMDACTKAGIKNILIDPGFGFGKTYEHNCMLMRELTEFKRLNAPILVGLSRKSFLGKMTDTETDERLWASVGASALAVRQGAWMIRVHDVPQNLDAIKTAAAFFGDYASV